MKPGRIIGLIALVGSTLAVGFLLSWPAAILYLLFISGAPLFTIMIGGAILGALSLPRDFDAEFDGMVRSILNLGLGDRSQEMSTIPLFIYAGYLLAEAKTADRLVRFATALLGWMPGGLAIVTIWTCALFTVFTGASGVTIIALGGVLMPALVRNGYPERFSLGLIAGTGSVGLLFPPALPLFIYGAVYGLTQLEPEIWDTRRFLFAGVVPGAVLISMLAAVAMFVAIKRKLPTQKFDLGELGRSFLAAAPELFIPAGVILALASGIGLPEVAALTVLYVLILELGILRMVDIKVLWTVSREAMAMVGAIFIIILGSSVLTNFMVTAEVPQALVEWTKEHVEAKWVFLLAINVLLLFVGTVMDIFSAMVVVLPLIAPIAKAYGIDPYHLGVIFLLNLEVGYLHPPVGLNLFLTSVKFQRPITEVMWATMPFLITMIIALLVITYVPWLTAVSVPEAERTGTIGNLASMVENGMEEAKVSISEIKLVDSAGNELKDDKGQPIIRKFVACNAITNETDRNTCQQLFFDVTACIPNSKKIDAQQQQCANEAIAKWTVSQLNGDPQDLEKAVVVVSEVALVNAEGAPLNAPDGKQIVKKLSACPPKAGEGQNSDRDSCRALFIEVSSCKIAPDAADCIAERTKECAAPAESPGGAGSAGSAGSDAGSAGSAGSAAGSAGSAAPAASTSCQTEKAAACRSEKGDECAKEKIWSWVEEYAGTKHLPEVPKPE